MQELAKEIWEVNESKGFHNPEVYDREMAELLILSESFEMLEAHRSSRWASIKPYKKSLELEPHKKTFNFETFIKNSVEDELADVVIRTLDYAIQNNIKIDYNNSAVDFEYCEYYDNNIKMFIRDLIFFHNEEMIYNFINHVLYSCFNYAKSNNIDLDWFIREKLEYNKTRDYLHNKRY
jgi:NTP pyrophosphatase (non-canonical NTP hydrolase)